MAAKFEQYDHHGDMMWVRKDLKGTHRDNCLCYECRRFNPDDRQSNCPIANMLYSMCVLAGLVTPVYECKEFEPGCIDELKEVMKENPDLK